MRQDEPRREEAGRHTGRKERRKKGEELRKGLKERGREIKRFLTSFPPP